MSFLIELEYPAAYERQPSRRLPLARRFSIGSALRRLRLLLLAPVVALLSAGLIMYETQQIVNGGETNYVLATVSLFVSIFNLFTSLLSLFGFASSDD